MGNPGLKCGALHLPLRKKHRTAAIGLGLLGLAALSGLRLLHMQSIEVDLVQHMKLEFYDETGAEKKVAEWGNHCIPILIGMLNASPGEAEKVAFYLGKTGSRKAVGPLIKYVERLLADGSEKRFGYLALGWIGNDAALEYLAKAAENPKMSEQAIHGLEQAGSRKALALLEQLDSTLGAGGPKNLSSALTRTQEAIERKEGLQESRSATKTNANDLDKFWSRQGALDQDAANQIIGEYVGTAYWTDFFNDNKIEDVRIIFRRDGVFETNLALLTNMERLDMRTGTPELLSDFAQGQYQVLGPSQLALGTGEGVSTHGFSMEQETLSFYHRRLGAFFSLGKNPGKNSLFSAKDVAGVYSGHAYVAEDSSSGIKRVEGVEIVFSDNGYFNTNFGSKYGKLFLGINTFDGTYQIDEYGKLVCFSKVGGGDFFGGDAVSFFDWHVRKNVLHLNHFQGAYYGCAMAFSPSEDAVAVNTDEVLETLTSGTYTGSAFRTTPEGRIVEIPGIQLRFSKEGIYSGNFESKLRPAGQQYYPADDGPFVVLSDRQLYMADKWEGDQVTNQGICDVLVTENELYFTSLNRDAYFTLKK